MRTLVVDNRELAAVIAGARGTSYLAPYFEGPCSISEAARRSAQPLAKTHYWTHRWHELGVLEVVETRARKGRPIKLYRTVADRFEVPPELLPESLLRRQMDEVNRELHEGLIAAAPEVAVGGTLVMHKPAEHRHVTLDRSPRGVPRRWDIHQGYFSAHLTPEQAAQLRAELEALRDRWLQAADHEGAPTYLVSLAITPVPPDRRR